MTLTSLLNSTIQSGETELDLSLDTYLQGLEDGTYKVASGSLTVATTADDLDTITGDWTSNSGDLTVTSWYTGTETASQSLIDLVTGLGQSGVYFAFDTDSTTVNTPASYESVTDTWANNTATLTSTDWFGNLALATSLAGELQIDKLAFGVSVNNSGSIVAVAWDAGLGQVRTFSSASPTVARNWATDYTAASSVTTNTVDTLYWDGDSVETMTFGVGESTTFAETFTEGFTAVTWDTSKQSVLGMTLTGTDGLVLTIV